MEYKFTLDNPITLTEDEFINIDFADVTFEIKENKTELNYSKDLTGTIKVWGDDFDTMFDFFNSGLALIDGNFYSDNIAYFNQIKYKLDAESFDIESRVAQFEIYAIDTNTVLSENSNKKINIYSVYDLNRASLTIYKRRGKLYYYQTEIVGSSEWTYSLEGIYAREEIKNASLNEINTLVGLNGWILSGSDIVRPWDTSGDFNTPTLYPGDIKSFYSYQDNPATNLQGYFTVFSGVYYNFIQSDDFLNEYTVLKVYERNNGSEDYYEIYVVDNESYYRDEREYNYWTIKNGLGLKDTVTTLTKTLDSTVTTVNFDYQTIFGFATGEAIILQGISEIALCHTEAQINGTGTITAIGQINPATIGYLTLDKLNTFLRDYWNIYYYRVENTIYYKHFSEMFDFATENDLTVSQFGDLTPLQIVAYNNQEKFKKIERDPTAENIDFIGVDAEFTDVKTDNVKVVNSQNFFTDINDAVGNSDKYNANSNDGWVFAHRASNSTIVAEKQILSDRYDTFINEKMSLAWADENLLVGSDKTANINGTAKTITDLFDYATLIDFEIPPAKVFEIIPRGYFKTAYSENHRLQNVTLKLDGSAGILTLYY